jgi:hypothetical protein
MIFAGPPLGLRPGRRCLPRLCLRLLLLLLILRIGRLCSLQPQVDGLAEVDDLEGEAGLWIRIDLMRIRIQHFFKLRIQIQIPMRIRFQIQGFDDQKLQKIYSGTIFYISFIIF